MISKKRSASTEYVSDHRVTVPDIVDPPQIYPVATRVGTTYNVSVSFTPAVTGGTAASYIVTAYQVPGYTPTTYTATGTSSPIVVSNLPGSSIYRFKVQGVNASGTGPVSYPSNSVGFDDKTPYDDSGDKTNLGEGHDGHHYYWGDRP